MVQHGGPLLTAARSGGAPQVVSRRAALSDSERQAAITSYRGQPHAVHAIEIASPGQGSQGLRADCAWYVAHGVPLALPVDPDDESIVVHRPGVPPQRLHGSDRIDFGDTLPSFQLVVQELFEAVRFD